MPRPFPTRMLPLLCLIAFVVLTCSSVRADVVEIPWQDLTKPITFILPEFVAQEELVIAIRKTHWAKQGEVGFYESDTSAPNPDSDVIKFRNVGPSAFITFISDPGDLQFGPMHDFRIVVSEAQRKSLTLDLDTTEPGVFIRVTMVSDGELSLFTSDSITIQVLPEPASVALLVTGVLALAPAVMRLRRTYRSAEG